MSFGYAPPLLPDEILYSWLGRLSLLNVLGTPRECVEHIFGSKTIIPGIDLPTRLQSVQRLLGNWSPFQSIDQLLDVGTLLPYHRPFLTAVRYKAIRKLLLHGDGKGLKTQIGRVANRFGANPPLRFCPKCVVSSITDHGSPYWVRQHQLPGVNCCVRHGIQLWHHTPLHLRTDRQRFVVLTDSAASTQHVKASKWQLSFAELSKALLDARLPVTDAHQRAEAYRHAAVALGFKTHIGRIDYRALSEEIKQHYENFRCFEHRDRLLTSADLPLGWVRGLIERPERSSHPICHLLLIAFLFGSISGFVKACSTHQIETTSRKHQKDLPLSTSPMGTLFNTDYEETLRNSNLSCRQVAKLVSKSVTTVVAQRRARGISIRDRRKSLGETLLELIRSELSSGNSPPIVAAHTGVSLSTVYRVRAQYKSSQPPIKRSPDPTNRRDRWLCSLSAHRHAGVNAARSAAPADYAWLYRHDRAWLISTTRSITKPPKSVTRVDWGQRDENLSQKTLAYATTLQNRSPPIHITKTLLLRPLGETMVRRNIQRLPLLKDSLDRNSESHDAFRKRRIDYAIATLANSTKNFQIWRIKRLSGLRLWSDSLFTYTRQELEKLHAQNSIRADSIS